MRIGEKRKRQPVKRLSPQEKGEILKRNLGAVLARLDAGREYILVGDEEGWRLTRCPKCGRVQFQSRKTPSLILPTCECEMEDETTGKD